ncbi:hypothetical protein NB688_004125 [Xanthomonas sacchari]|uniref:DUF3016 domain-containing protein n=1 Tax=Xanthomonas sacchari TaxID=56458 RepID=A0ABT3E1B4_9XANT|nr:DUF3016 domain-containing protein [Xanthomonas sacchari]MCW0401551.1 hypothetical protein [Xanthomonas sacchari]MCW0421959.1 hypothetical protein [Xanthomonas sacchari]UYK72251.1 DUF3016 domain-containing protein [Xanthomonas sacchari]
MKIRYAWTALAVACLWAGGASAEIRNVTDPQAPRSLVSDGPVQVSWAAPSTFSELRQSRNRWEAERGDWVQDLAAYLQKQAAKQLQPGQRLDIKLTDIKRAGDFEPWHGPNWNDVRVMRDLYPPRISLDFTLYGADGQVIAQGQPKLMDPSYLYNSSVGLSTDPLRYEKRMLDDWLRRQFRNKDSAVAER